MGINSYSLQQNEPGFPGQLVDARSGRILSRKNSGGTTTSRTLTLGGATGAGTDYIIEVTWNGVTETVTYASAGGDGANDIAAGISAAFDASPLFNGLLDASVATNVVTLSGRIKGLNFTVAAQTNSADITVGGSAASEASNILPGRAVVELASDLGGCRLPNSDDDTAKVITATFGGSFTATDPIHFTVMADLNDDGELEVYEFSTPSVTDLATTIDNLNVQASAALDANYIVVTNTATTLIFTSQYPNLDFEVRAWVEDAAFGTPTQTVSIADSTALVDLKFLGVSMLDRTRPGNSSRQFPYAAGDLVNICEDGVIFVELDAGITPTIGDPVFARAVASASEALGAFRDARDGADCILIHPRRARWVNSSAYTVNGVRVAALALQKQ
jgi:hypothetical protein